eukprot:m.17551 g.17551  ORF g.17551 m.17551 type:complete len:266 (-) comp8159_c0_seq1:197-994(-)
MPYVGDVDAKDLRFLARMAEQAGRFNDMVKIIRKFVASTTKYLSKNDAKIISTAYRNVVIPRRAAWRIIAATNDTASSKTYLSQVETELSHYCWDAIEVSEIALKKCNKDKRKLFFKKMKADYYRYLSELDVFHFQSNGKSTVLDINTVKCASAGYKDAMLLYESCRESHQQSHPRPSSPSAVSRGSNHSSTDTTYLSLVLNFAVFTKEILGNTQEAVSMSEEAFDTALADIDRLRESERETVTSIMHIIQNNLTLWKDEMQSCS